MMRIPAADRPIAHRVLELLQRALRAEAGGEPVPGEPDEMEEDERR